MNNLKIILCDLNNRSNVWTEDCYSLEIFEAKFPKLKILMTFSSHLNDKRSE